ncbi:MAG: hypothetical protein GY926_15240 [bacterium]|nr:hypothetical protein [bacterium]MCP4966569.1 hypothetical protein [bacterium]
MTMWPTVDLDVLVNARIVTGGVAAFDTAIELRGFNLEATSSEGLAHRYRRDGVSIDVLAIEGLGPRTNLTTTPPGRTLQVPGGTQALSRTELLPIHTTTSSGHVPRPALLGAIIAKALAVDIDDTPRCATPRSGLPTAPCRGTTGSSHSDGAKDRRRLRARTELADPQQPAWQLLAPNGRDRARAALAILLR